MSSQKWTPIQDYRAEDELAEVVAPLGIEPLGPCDEPSLHMVTCVTDITRSGRIVFDSDGRHPRCYLSTKPACRAGKRGCMSESESLQIIIELPPEIELSEEELGKLLERFRSWLIDTKPEQKALQTKVKQIQARVGGHKAPLPRHK